MDYERTLSKIVTRGLLLSFGDYLLSSGVKSPYYIDFSLLANRPSYLKMVNDILVDFISRKKLANNVDRLAAISNKGIMFITHVSISLMKPFVFIDKYSGELVFGDINPGDKILIIDDLINTGRTLEFAIDKLKNMYHAEPYRVVVMIDREEGGKRKLSKYNIKIYSVTKLSKLAKVLLELGGITDEQYDIIASRIKKMKG